MLASAIAMTTHRALAYACVLASIPATMSASAFVDQLVGQAFKPVSQRCSLCRLQVSRFGRTTSANQIHDARHDLDEPVVVLPELAKQLDFVPRDELQAIHVVAKLVEPAQRAQIGR